MSKKGEGQRSIFDFLFGGSSKKQKEETKNFDWVISVDGASRGNPGQSGAGVFIKKGDAEIVRSGFYLGNRTNNEAEYLALLIAVMFLQKERSENETVKILSDSQLLIRQMQGVYKIKKPELKVIYDAIWQELGTTECFFEHVERDKNTIADSLANHGVDTKNSLPLKFLDKLRTYEIFL